MENDKEFLNLVRDIHLNKAVLEPFWRASERGENFDFALSYAVESVDGRKTFKNEVDLIGKNMRDEKWSKDRAARAWRENIKLDPSDSGVFPIERAGQGIEDWVAKNLLDFLRRYLVGGLKSSTKKPVVTPVSPPPASVPATKQPPKAAPKTTPAPLLVPTTKPPSTPPPEIPKSSPTGEMENFKFRTIVKKINANEKALREHYKQWDDYAANYAKESAGTDGGPPKSLDEEIAHIVKDMKDDNITTQMAVDKWLENIDKSGDLLLFKPEKKDTLEIWVRKHLVDFLTRYYDGWPGRPEASSSPATTLKKTTPAKTPSITPPKIVPEAPTKKPEPPKPTQQPPETESESSTQSTTAKGEEEEQFVQPFTLPKRGGVFRTMEELSAIDGFIQRQDAFPTLEYLTGKAEKVTNACFGPKWQAAYSLPETSVAKLEGPQTETLRFQRKPANLPISGDKVFMKSVNVKDDRTTNKEGLMDIVIGTRMNFLLQAKLVRGFVRMYDWYICTGEMMSEVRSRGTGEITEKMARRTRIFTFQENASDTLAMQLMLSLLVSPQAFLSGFAQLCVALEGGQSLVEYVHYDLHTRNVNMILSETQKSVLEFNRPYRKGNLYIDLLFTEGKEVKIIDYGRNRMRSSYVYGDKPNEVIFLETAFNLGISGRFHPQYDLRFYVIDLIHQMAIAQPEKKLGMDSTLLGMLDLLAGSKHVRTTREEIDRESRIYTWNNKEVSGDFGIWANGVFNYTRRKNSPGLTGEAAKNEKLPEVEAVLLEFKKKGLKYLHKQTRKEVEAGGPVIQGYYPTAFKLVCFWAWTPMIWDGPTPSMILDDPLFNFLRVKPDNRDIVKAVEYKSLQDFKIGFPLQSIGGPSSDWWPRLKAYWDALPPQPRSQLEDFPDFYRVFSVNRIISHGSDGLIFEIEDLNPTMLGRQKRVLKLLPTVAFGQESYTRLLINEARIHSAIDQICVATPEFFGIFRIPVNPLKKIIPDYKAALLQWDPSGKLSRETHMIGMITEYIEGVTLKTYIHQMYQNREGLDETGLTAIALPLALQIKCLHDEGIVHRDLHMSNVMVDTEHQSQVRIIDFGMATSTENPESFLKEGNWTYVPPEARGENSFLTYWKKARIDFKKMDIYSLGMILLKAGNLKAFQEEEIDDAFELFHPKQMIPGSVYLSALVSRMLHPDPEKRPSIDTVIETIIKAKPEFSASDEWYSWWKNVKVSAHRIWSMLFSAKESTKHHRHEREALERSQSPVRPPRH